MKRDTGHVNNVFRDGGHRKQDLPVVLARPSLARTLASGGVGHLR